MPEISEFQLRHGGPEVYESVLVAAQMGRAAMELVDAARIGPDDLVLDVACGTGVQVVLAVDDLLGNPAAERHGKPRLAPLLRVAELVALRQAHRHAERAPARLALGDDVDLAEALRLVRAVSLVRDLVNTPTADMGPEALEAAARELAKEHGASVKVATGEKLLKENFPVVHAVGRAAGEAPRMIEIEWGEKDAPKLAIVGKGVCFDTGGLNLKPGDGMRLMKKDMGGAAHALGLASLVMGADLPVRLHVLIPAVENAVGANAFRPGDILSSRAGLTIEVENTDAEGRLVLADALGYDLKIVTGYEGDADTSLAVIKGEADGHMTTWTQSAPAVASAASASPDGSRPCRCSR